MLKENAAKALSDKLFKQAMRLTDHNQDAAMELVQEVWVKVLTHEKCDVEQMNASYLNTVLKNHFYDKWRKKTFVVFDDSEKMNEGNIVLEDENNIESNTGRINVLLNYLKHHKDGWIYQEMVDRGCSLKTLSQVRNIKYDTLCQKKRRLDLLLQQRFGTNFNKTGGG